MSLLQCSRYKTIDKVLTMPALRGSVLAKAAATLTDNILSGNDLSSTTCGVDLPESQNVMAEWTLLLFIWHGCQVSCFDARPRPLMSRRYYCNSVLDPLWATYVSYIIFLFLNLRNLFCKNVKKIVAKIVQVKIESVKRFEVWEHTLNKAV